MRYPLGCAALAVCALVSAACGSTRDAAGPTDTSAAARSSAPPSLVGPTWRLVSLDGREALSGVRVTAVFGDDNRVTGTAGCNRYFGPAVAAAGRLDVGRLGSSRMHCGANGVMTQEQAYLAALERAGAYALRGGELRLGPVPGVVTLVFELE
jgi:heat shock protein HslJ